MERPRVFVSAPLPGAGTTRLEPVAEVVVGAGGAGLSDPRFGQAPERYDGLITLYTDRVDAALFARATRLRVVANVAVGIDNIDLEAARAHGVTVTHTPGVLTEATADFAFALLLAAARRVCEGDRIMREGRFPAWTPTLLVGARVSGATLGIVGMGRIGQAMARRALGFGMQILYAQRHALSATVEQALSARRVSLDSLFEESDFVSLHCPLTPETKKLVSRERLATMKAGAVLVNAARGACVDEAALVSALATGPLGAAGLDVFEDESRVAPGLVALPNVVITPHIGSAERPTREAMAAMAIENMVVALGGAKPPNEVRIGAG